MMQNVIIASANSEIPKQRSQTMENTKNTGSSTSQSLLLFVSPIDNGWVQNVMTLQLASSATIIICVDGIENKTLSEHILFAS